MELQHAREIIDTLSQGIHPVTGEVMPLDSPYNAPPVIRALFAVSRALQHCEPSRPRREAPANAGKPWTAEEDSRLQVAFEAGQEIRQLALAFGRSRIAVEARLVRLGQLEARPGLPVRSGHES